MSTSSARGDPLLVTTTWLNTGSNAASIAVTSLSAITPSTPTRKWKSNSVVSASASAAAPAGLWAASMNTVGALRIRSNRPGLAAAAKPARTASMSSWRWAPAPKKASTAASASAAFCAWYSPCSGRNTSEYTPPRPCSSSSWPPTATCRLSTANSESARATAASARTAWASSTSIASGSWRPITATVSTGTSSPRGAPMMPAFSAAISAIVSPRYSAWSTPIGVITATAASTTLVASHRPPIPTSMTAMSTGASANAANAIAVTTSNLLIAGPPSSSDLASIMCTNGSISR